MLSKIFPKDIIDLSHALLEMGKGCYAVGGCVRDLVRKARPHDYDLATGNTPSEIIEHFKDHEVYKVVETGAKFGTVTILTPMDSQVQVTTFRKDGRYSDNRRPDEVTFSDNIVDDMGRRDFTMNALAVNMDTGDLIDHNDGIADIEQRVIRTVGLAGERFSEDPLRMLRAMRFRATLGFALHENVITGILNNQHKLAAVSKERVRDELNKMLVSEDTESLYIALKTMVDTELMEHVIPELYEGDGMPQCRGHIYTVLDHNLRACVATPPVLHLRLAALMHDIGKARCLRHDENGRHFYDHQFESAKMVLHIMERLKYPSHMIETVHLLVKEHMFMYEPQSGLRVARRIIARMGGKQGALDLVEIRKADRAAMGGERGTDGSGDRLANALKELEDEDAIFRVTHLAIGGKDVMQALNIPAGPYVGMMLDKLLQRVIEEPELNTREKLFELLNTL